MLRITHTQASLTVSLSKELTDRITQTEHQRAQLTYDHPTRTYSVIPHPKGYKLRLNSNGSSNFTLQGRYFSPSPPLHSTLTSDTDTLMIPTDTLKPPKQKKQPSVDTNFLISFNGKTYAFNVPEHEAFDVVLELTKKGYMT